MRITILAAVEITGLCLALAVAACGKSGGGTAPANVPPVSNPPVSANPAAKGETSGKAEASNPGGFSADAAAIANSLANKTGLRYRTYAIDPKTQLTGITTLKDLVGRPELANPGYSMVSITSYFENTNVRGEVCVDGTASAATIAAFLGRQPSADRFRQMTTRIEAIEEAFSGRTGYELWLAKSAAIEKCLATAEKLAAIQDRPEIRGRGIKAIFFSVLPEALDWQGVISIDEGASAEQILKVLSNAPDVETQNNVNERRERIGKDFTHRTGYRIIAPSGLSAQAYLAFAEKLQSIETRREIVGKTFKAIYAAPYFEDTDSRGWVVVDKRASAEAICAHLGKQK